VEIPVAIYEEITGLSDLPPPVDEADYERRRHRRVPFGHRATISLDRKGGDATPAVVMMRDVSSAGVSFLHGEALKAGLPLVIEFKGYQDRPVKLRCMVARCEAGGAGGVQFVVGASFVELLTKEAPPQKPIEIPKLVELAPAETVVAEARPLEPLKLEPTPEILPHADKPISVKDQVRIIDRLKKSAHEAEKAAPLVPRAVPIAAAPVKSSTIFKSPDPAPAANVVEEYWSDGGLAGASKAAAEPSDPVFRVFPIQQQPKEIVISVDPAPPSPEAHEEHANNHSVLARVKELLVKQEQSIEAQRQELKGQRERFEREIESLRSELEDTNKKLAELRDKSEADDNAIADLATFLKQHEGSESSVRKHEAA
jgi:hypothetical protein